MYEWMCEECKTVNDPEWKSCANCGAEHKGIIEKAEKHGLAEEVKEALDGVDL